MKIGVQIRATSDGVDLAEMAQAVETAGLESLFLPEHTHVPVGGSSRHPGGDDLMDAAKRGIDPFVGLAVVAAATKTLRIGTGVCLLPQHDPIVLAKTISTLDSLSGGRFIFGIGAGWSREEMANHGVRPSHRWDVMREKALAMIEIWTHEEASFHGRFVDFGPIWQWPKPRQKPHPPVLIGGEGAGVLGRVLEYGIGWLPNYHADVYSRIGHLNSAAADRNIARTVTVYATPLDSGLVRRLADVGVERCVFNLQSENHESFQRSLDAVVDLRSSAV